MLPKSNSIFWPQWAVLVALAITTAASTNPATSLIFSASWAAAVFIWWVSWGWGQMGGDMSKYRALIIALATAVALSVAVEAAQGITRPSGLLAGPNLAAVVVAIGMAYAYPLLASPWRWGLAGTAVAVILLTGSRSGLIALMVGLAAVDYLEMRAGKHTRLEGWFMVAMWGVFLAGALAVTTYSRPELAAVSTETVGIYYRWDFWRVALEGFASRPLVGHGPGMYRSLWIEHGPVGAFPFHAAHNLPLNIAAEMGAVGLVAWGWLATALLGWLRSTWANVPHQRGIVGVLVVFAIHATFDTPEWDILLLVGSIVAMWSFWRG